MTADAITDHTVDAELDVLVEGWELVNQKNRFNCVAPFHVSFVDDQPLSTCCGAEVIDEDSVPFCSKCHGHFVAD